MKKEIKYLQQFTLADINVEGLKKLRRSVAKLTYKYTGKLYSND